MTDEELALMDKDLQAELDRDIEIYGMGFAKKFNQTWYRVPPDQIIIARATGIKTPQLDNLEDQARALPTWALGQLKRFVDAEYNLRISQSPGLTDDEVEVLYQDRLKAVRMVADRTKLSLIDAKELVERWLTKNRRTPR